MQRPVTVVQSATHPATVRLFGKAIVALSPNVRSVKCNYLIENRTSDLPACTIEPQPATLPGVPSPLFNINNIIKISLKTRLDQNWSQRCNIRSEQESAL